MKKFILLSALSVVGYVGSDVSSKTQTAEVGREEIPSLLLQSADTVANTVDTVPVILEHKITWDDFVNAVIYVESRGNDSAYHKKEKAVGCLQIRPIMVREVNRILRKHKVNLKFEMDDRWNRQKSIDMFDIMAEEVECCLGLSQLEFFEIVARKWNGGPRGHKKKSTKIYWERVQKELLD